MSKLSGAERLYKIRVGDYRIVYEVDTAALQVTIHYVRHRREAYRKLQTAPSLSPSASSRLNQSSRAHTQVRPYEDRFPDWGRAYRDTPLHRIETGWIASLPASPMARSFGSG